MWTELSATAAAFLFAGLAFLNWIQEEAWGRWLLSEYCVHRKALSLSTLVCVCVCVWQGACIHFLNPKEGVPECPNCHFCILSSGTSFLRTADALRCWRRGQENEDRSKRRNARKATWISFSWCDKSMCFFCFFFFWMMGTFLWESYLKIWVEIWYFHYWPFIFHHWLENCFLASSFNHILLKAQCSKQKGFC